MLEACLHGCRAGHNIEILPLTPLNLVNDLDRAESRLKGHEMVLKCIEMPSKVAYSEAEGLSDRDRLSMELRT